MVHTLTVAALALVAVLVIGVAEGAAIVGVREYLWRRRRHSIERGKGS